MSSTCTRCGGAKPTAWPANRPCPRCLLALGLEDEDGPAPFVVTGAAGEAADALGPAPSAAELDALFPDLEVLELIGEGGMGAVYRARQIQLDRPVALKVLRRLVDPDGSLGERFLREARSLAKLSHPGIVSIYDVGRAGDRVYLLMELVQGTNLRTLLEAGELTPAQCLDLVSQMCAALQSAHELGVVHRDVKPENVLVDTKGRVKIVDFGLAKIASAPDSPRLTMTGQAMGTPQYMAPEQIERPLDVDHRADLYSLGVVIYELLTGELPLGRFAPPSEKPGVDSRLDEVVHRALEKDPERRYQAASDMGSQVNAIRTTPPPAASAGGYGAVPPPLPDPDDYYYEEAARQAPRQTRWGLGCLIACGVFFLILMPLTCALFFVRSSGGMELEPARTSPGGPAAPAPVESFGESAEENPPSAPDER